MNDYITDFAADKLQEVRGGKNPGIALSEMTGYLEALEATDQITPIERVDFLYEFSVELVSALHPDIKTEKEVMEKINSWKIVLDSIADRM